MPATYFPFGGPLSYQTPVIIPNSGPLSLRWPTCNRRPLSIPLVDYLTIGGPLPQMRLIFFIGDPFSIHTENLLSHQQAHFPTSAQHKYTRKVANSSALSIPAGQNLLRKKTAGMRSLLVKIKCKKIQVTLCCGTIGGGLIFNMFPLIVGWMEAPQCTSCQFNDKN